MTRKRRMFDIGMPSVSTLDEAPVGDAPRRRGPMASAISENAEALRDRKSAAEAIRAENDALAHEYVAAKAAGQVVQTVPLEEIHTYMLVRDRLPGDDYEMEELVTSIRETGLSNPIRVVERAGGDGFELVQGFRRLSAYRRLAEEDGQGGWGAIPALVVDRDIDVGGLYRRMVDENVVRKDLSFAEMAHAAQVYVADPQTDAQDLSDAISALFASAPYSKRSYIRSFARLLDAIGGSLKFPSEVPRALGLTVARNIKDNPQIAGLIRKELDALDNRSIREEQEVLRRYADVDEFDLLTAEIAPPAKETPKDRAGGKTKTTFHLQSVAGQVKCTASQGRLEIKVDRDFSAIDRDRLERAVADLVNGL